MGFFGDFFSRLGSIPTCVIGALIGFCAGVIVLTVGIFPLLLLVVLTLCGFIIGKMMDEDAPAVSLLKRFFSSKKSKDDDEF